jgi:hypothetical protein
MPIEVLTVNTDYGKYHIDVAIVPKDKLRNKDVFFYEARSRLSDIKFYKVLKRRTYYGIEIVPCDYDGNPLKDAEPYYTNVGITDVYMF